MASVAGSDPLELERGGKSRVGLTACFTRTGGLRSGGRLVPLADPGAAGEAHLRGRRIITKGTRKAASGATAEVESAPWSHAPPLSPAPHRVNRREANRKPQNWGAALDRLLHKAFPLRRKQRGAHDFKTREFPVEKKLAAMVVLPTLWVRKCDQRRKRRACPVRPADVEPRSRGPTARPAATCSSGTTRSGQRSLRRPDRTSCDIRGHFPDISPSQA